ncbi:oxalate decarboxylase family bicupin [Gorillibacterium sp. sgz5001074]|uniref:oxalate decarboxylase family bicupin n=1 Tax=Gorillibacterium sp. sgz5001074 TaxID=3446695 RepID=UPI003F66C863
MNQDGWKGPIPQPIRKDGAGWWDLGPRDVMRDLENPDMLVSPATDAGMLPNLKFSFSDTNMQLNHGGWSREVTVRQLPVATTLAGVNMALTPGGVRELHWHQQAEWAIVLVGSARVTAVDQNGRNFIADVGVGDLWYFPPGIPHSIQGLAEGCEFLLVFDDGNFSDLHTLSLSDWFAHTPTEVVASNFGVPEQAFAQHPKGQRYIFQAPVPGPLECQAVEDPNGTVPLSFTHKLLAQEPIIAPGGTVRIVDSSNFPISTRIAASLLEIKPGAMREMHWHPNNDEWQYYISGKGRMTVLAPEGTARTFDYRAGDVGYVPFAFGHYIQNTGDQSLWVLEMFRSDRFEDVSLNQWLALTPHDLVQNNLHVGSDFTNALHKAKRFIVK